MPVKYFSCPPDKKKFGEYHDVEYCCTKCEEQCYSPFLMAAIYGVNIRNHHKGRYVSATALSGCKRRLQLERTIEYAEEYQSLYAAFRGTITHTVIEEAMETAFPSGHTLASLGFIAEWNMIVGFCLKDGHGAFPVDPNTDPDDLAFYAQNSCPVCDAEGCAREEQNWILLGGTLDGAAPVFDLDAPQEHTIFVDSDGTAHYKLSDVKSMKEYAISYFIKGDPKNTLHPQIKDDYVRQARVYSYLAERAQVPAALAALGIKRIKMVRSDIQAFAMGEAPWTGGGTFRWKDNFRNALKDWPMYPIDLGTTEWVENYIRTEAKPLLEYFIQDGGRAPIRKPDQAWLCAGYCSFAGTDLCPNPDVEESMLNSGTGAEAAFQEALQYPMILPDKPVGALTEIDTQNIDNFQRKQRGEAPAEKLVKPRAKRVSKKKEAA